MLPDSIPCSPSVAREIDGRELARLLGLPRGAVADSDVPGVGPAVSWYETQGRPWVASRTLQIAAVEGDRVSLSIDESLHSRRLAERLTKAEADLLVLVLVSAGPEVAQEAKRRWDSDRPEESFALDRLAAAVTEHLLARAGAMLCQVAEPEGRFVVPRSSPGHDGWDVAEQVPLFDLLGTQLRGPVEVLPSGMLRPVASQLAVFGVARGEPGTARPAVPCGSCSFSPCSYRRAAFEPGGA